MLIHRVAKAHGVAQPDVIGHGVSGRHGVAIKLPLAVRHANIERDAERSRDAVVDILPLPVPQPNAFPVFDWQRKRHELTK